MPFPLRRSGGLQYFRLPIQMDPRLLEIAMWPVRLEIPFMFTVVRISVAWLFLCDTFLFRI